MYKSQELVERFKAPWMVVYVIVVGVFLAVGATLSVTFDRQAEERRVPMPQRKSVAFVMAAVGGVFGGNTILCAKTVGELISTSIKCAHEGTLEDGPVRAQECDEPGQGIFNWATPVFVAALVFNLLLQVRFLNEAIRRFAMLMVIPVYQTFWILSGTLSGLIYCEYAPHPPTAARFPGMSLDLSLTDHPTTARFPGKTLTDRLCLQLKSTS